MKRSGVPNIALIPSAAKAKAAGPSWARKASTWRSMTVRIDTRSVSDWARAGNAQKSASRAARKALRIGRPSF